MKTYGILLAGGVGSRFGTEVPKQFAKVAGKKVIEHTLDVFERHPSIDYIIIVVNPYYVEEVKNIVIRNKYSKVIKILGGGKTRQESSYIGISSIEDEEAFVVIHDAVRPFISYRILDDCIDSLKYYDAVDVAIPATDTIIEVDENFLITNIPDRKRMWRGQTPQCFKLSVIKKAHEKAKEEGFVGTDDCGLVLRYNLGEIYVVKGDRRNIKITYPEDIYLADKIFLIKGEDDVTQILKPINQIREILKDKVIVVFGGTSGIGKSIVDICNQHGIKVYATSRRTGVDVSNYMEVKKFLEEIYNKERKIDAIVNTVGILKMGLLEHMKEKEILEQINTNYIGSINVVKASIPLLRKSGGGHIILFASSSYTRGRKLYSIYSSTKAAIVNFSQAVADEVIVDDIKINVISPERTKTPMRIKNFGYEPEETLLKPEQVAYYTLGVLTTDYTGLVFEVKREMFLRGER